MEDNKRFKMTLEDIININPVNKFLRLSLLSQKEPSLFVRSDYSSIFKYQCYTQPDSSHKENIVHVHYKCGSGIMIEENTFRREVIDMEFLVGGTLDSTRKFNCDVESCVFRYANIAEIFGSTINILRNGESNN